MPLFYRELLVALKKNLALMGATTAIRLGAGLFTFALLARLLGPESFGVLMLWLSVAALLALITNFGLTPYVLREIGASPISAESIINEGLTGKLILTAVVFICSIIAVWSLGIDFKLAFLCLLVAAIADTFSEFLNAGFRARDRFDVETRIATITSFAHAAIVSGAVFVYPTVEAAALAYAFSRLLVLAVTLPAVARYFSAPRLAGFDTSLARLRKAINYAIDFGFQSLFGKIDSIVLNHFIGPVSVGLYQAGMRVFEGGATAAQVLANVFLPRAAGKTNNATEFARESNRVQAVFLIVGALFGIALAVFSEIIVNVLFGTAYSSLVAFFPLFGLLFFVRFAAAAWGVVLTASGEQRYRTWATIIHWILIAAIAPFLVPDTGVAGWLVALIIGNTLLGFLYALRGAKRVDSPWTTVVMTALGGIAFVPFFHSFT